MIFRRATLRLTIAYTVIQLALFAVFAIGVYSFVTGTFDFDAVEGDGDTAVNAAEHGFALLRTGLIACYAVLLVLIPLSSWLMARSALRPIRATFERQQQFVDGASHEMRTPLSVIQGELELALSRSRSPAEYQQAITSALVATTGLIRLTDDLLKLSQTTKEQLTSSFTRFELNDAVLDAIGGSADAARQSDIHITHDLAGTGEVTGSRELLTRALGNVLDNAIKYTPPGGHVAVTSSTGAVTHTVRIDDDGIGMSEDERAHAFDRFWRAERSRTSPGHGLGLALTQQVMAAHGGTVELRPGHRRGTTAIFTLPLAAGTPHRLRSSRADSSTAS